MSPSDTEKVSIATGSLLLAPLDAEPRIVDNSYHDNASDKPAKKAQLPMVLRARLVKNANGKAWTIKVTSTADGQNAFMSCEEHSAKIEALRQHAKERRIWSPRNIKVINEDYHDAQRIFTNLLVELAVEDRFLGREVPSLRGIKATSDGWNISFHGTYYRCADYIVKCAPFHITEHFLETLWRCITGRHEAAAFHGKSLSSAHARFLKMMENVHGILSTRHSSKMRLFNKTGRLEVTKARVHKPKGETRVSRRKDGHRKRDQALPAGFQCIDESALMESMRGKMNFAEYGTKLLETWLISNASCRWDVAPYTEGRNVKDDQSWIELAKLLNWTPHLWPTLTFQRTEMKVRKSGYRRYWESVESTRTYLSVFEKAVAARCEVGRFLEIQMLKQNIKEDVVQYMLLTTALDEVVKIIRSLWTSAGSDRDTMPIGLASMNITT